MPQVKENVENLVKTKKRCALWSKCVAKFGKVPKCAAGAKSLKTIALIYYAAVTISILQLSTAHQSRVAV